MKENLLLNPSLVISMEDRIFFRRVLSKNSIFSQILINFWDSLTKNLQPEEFWKSLNNRRKSGHFLKNKENLNESEEHYCLQIVKKKIENNLSLDFSTVFTKKYRFFSLKSILNPCLVPRGDILTLSAQISAHWLIPKYLFLYYFAYLLKYLPKPS